MQNVVLLIDPLLQAYDVSTKAGNMYLNRLCIDEEAAFETTGVYSLQTYREKRFPEVIRRITASKSNDLTIHFMCTINGRFFTDYWRKKLRSFIIEEMEHHEIKKVMVTILLIRRYNLITKETMESFCEGKKLRKDSINDDLESFFEKLRLGYEPHEDVGTYFLPKLTDKELKLAEKKDFDFFQTFDSLNPDVDEALMKASESESKFVQGYCWRSTFVIENELSEKVNSASSNNFFTNCCYLLKRFFNK